MKFSINENPTNQVQANFVRMGRHFFGVLQQTDKREWESLFNEFRLNLQSRIAGCDESTLLKLQAKIEFTQELEKFFLETVSAPSP